MERKQFTFYRSFYDAVMVMKSNEDKLALLLSVIEYALMEKEPDLPEHLLVAFTLVKPTLDTAREKSRWGSKGKKLGDSSSYSSEGSENKNYNYSYNEGEYKSKSESKKEKEKEKESKSKNEGNDEGHSDRPTTEQVRDFFRKMNLKGDPDRFWMFNEGKGWQVDNWQLAAVGWSGKEGQFEQETGRDAPRGDLLMKAISKRKEASNE